MKKPQIISTESNNRFEKYAKSIKLEPSSQWVGGYVDYEWNHLKVIIESYHIKPQNLRILEFGCNVGASAILLSYMGAEVTAIDVSESFVHLAKLNSERFGIKDIKFLHISDTRILPFENEQFDLVCCNSVLDIVDCKHLKLIQSEINRILKIGGKIIVLGTSNRLWPKELHSKNWFVNYIPRTFNRFLNLSLQRGIFPWTVRYGFGTHYFNLDKIDKGKKYLQSRKLLGARSGQSLNALLIISKIIQVSPGLLSPSISCILTKYKNQTENL